MNLIIIRVLVHEMGQNTGFSCTTKGDLVRIRVPKAKKTRPWYTVAEPIRFYMIKNGDQMVSVLVWWAIRGSAVDRHGAELLRS